MATSKKSAYIDKNAIKNLRDDINMLDITPSVSPNVSHASPIQPPFNHNSEIRYNNMLDITSFGNSGICYGQLFKSPFNHLKNDRLQLNSNNNNNMHHNHNTEENNPWNMDHNDDDNIMSEDNEEPSNYNNNNNDRKRGRMNTEKLPQPKKRKISGIRSEKEEEDDEDNEYDEIIKSVKLDLENKYRKREQKLIEIHQHENQELKDQIKALQMENEDLIDENKRVNAKLATLKEVLYNDDDTESVHYSDRKESEDLHSETRLMEETDEIDENKMDGFINNNNHNDRSFVSENVSINDVNIKPEPVPILSPIVNDNNDNELSPAFYGSVAPKNTIRCEWDDCSKKFKTKQQMLLHFRVHSNVKPYECSICGSKYTRKSTLTNHLRTKKHKEKEKLENKSPSNSI